jgi:2-iminoacetate synthase ThiH
MIRIQSKAQRLRTLFKKILATINPAFERQLFERRSKKLIILAASEAKKDVENYFKNPTLFRNVEIETVNRCNATCPFCGVNKNNDPRPFAKMKDETFRKIIDNLVKLNYDGTVFYHSNNEPFIDARIIDFIKYSTAALKNARH